MVESGQLFLPEEAHWLAEFRKELLAFPNCRHDDQVDAFTQLMIWVRNRWQDTGGLAGPILYWEDEYGNLHSSDDEDWEEVWPHSRDYGMDDWY